MGNNAKDYLKVVALFMVVLSFVCLPVYFAYGFNVINRTDTTIIVTPLQNPEAMLVVPPRSGAACDWKDKRCNPSGNKDADITCEVARKVYPGGFRPICHGVRVKADGKLYVWQVKSDGRRVQYECGTSPPNEPPPEH